MGHAIYTLSDPRATVLKSMAKKLAESKGLVDDFLLCDYIEKRTPQLYAEVTATKSLCRPTWISTQALSTMR